MSRNFFTDNDDIRFHPPIVLMLGLVSKSSLFDLYEGSSMARALVDAGFDVYVIRWGEADAGDAENTVEHYVQRYLPRMLRTVCRISGSEDTTLLGYCMGGNFALLAVAGVPDLPVRNLITMATPIDFDEMPPQFVPLRDERFDPRDFVDDSGCIPGDMVANFYELRRPTAAAAQLVSLAERLNDEQYVAIHQAIAHWTSDHVPMPIGVAEQVINHWLRENAFATGRLRLGGVPVDLQQITCPTLCVLTLRDEVIPPAAARPLDRMLGSEDFEMLELRAGHIGLAFGRAASQLLHPRCNLQKKRRIWPHGVTPHKDVPSLRGRARTAAARGVSPRDRTDPARVCAIAGRDAAAVRRGRPEGDAYARRAAHARRRLRHARFACQPLVRRPLVLTQLEGRCRHAGRRPGPPDRDRRSGSSRRRRGSPRATARSRARGCCPASCSASAACSPRCRGRRSSSSARR